MPEKRSRPSWWVAEEIRAGLSGDTMGYEEWAKRDSWTVYEAIELIASKVLPPGQEAEDRRTPLDEHRYGHPETERLRREMVRAIKNPKGCAFVDPDKGEGWVDPREFVRWAISKDYPVHKRLRKALAPVKYEYRDPAKKAKVTKHEVRSSWTGKRPKGWGDIVLNLQDDNRTLGVAIRAVSAPKDRPKAKDIQPCTYADLSFADKRTGEPVEAWKLLLALAEGSGVLTDPREKACRNQDELREASKASDRMHKQVSELNTRFQEFFGLAGKAVQHFNADRQSRNGGKVRDRYWRSSFVIGKV